MNYKNLLPLFLSFGVLASPHHESNRESWGVGLGVRSASIPFDTPESTVHDVMPLLMYQGDYFYLDGIGGGVKLYQNDDVTLGAMGRMRFFDIPSYGQNQIQGTQIDFGANAIWHMNEQLDLSFEVLSDSNGRIHSNLTGEYYLSGNGWDLTPYTTIRFKSAEFNNTYYGLQMEDIGAQVDIKAGAKGRYQIYKNLYGVGQLGVTVLDKATYNSQPIGSRTQLESYVGIALFNTPNQKTHSQMPEGSYIRVAHGLATTSSIGDLLALDNKPDPYNHTLTSLFYGHKVADSLFDWPMDLYLTPGFIQHHASEVQGRFAEYVIAMKAYYTVNWPVTWRFGFAEGVSYSTQVGHLERTSLEEKDLEPSKLMNYLDISLDVNMGSLFNKDSLSQLWVGYSLHHRSGIFTTSSAFGRIKGGSNYNSVYLQWDF